MAKKTSAPATPATMNSAPGYQFTAPPGAGAAQSFGAPPSNGSAMFTAPPPPAPRYPFINAQWLWQKFGQQGGGNAKIIGGRINTPRRLNNGNMTQPGWNLDFQFEDGTFATGTVNIGDIKHQRLFEKFQTNWIGQVVRVRLPHPGDNTKATWVVE